MASYLSTQVVPPVEVIGQAPTHQVETFSFTFSGQTIGGGDTITLAQIPIFSAVTDFYLSVSAALGTAPTFNIGTTTTPALIVSAGAIVASNLYANALPGFVPASLPTARFTTQTVAAVPAGLVLNPTSTVADYLLMTCVAGGAVATSATIKGYVRYTLNTVS